MFGAGPPGWVWEGEALSVSDPRPPSRLAPRPAVVPIPGWVVGAVVEGGMILPIERRTLDYFIRCGTCNIGKVRSCYAHYMNLRLTVLFETTSGSSLHVCKTL